MEGLRSLLSKTDIVTHDSDPASYNELTVFWAAQKNLKPAAVIVPSDVETLAKVVHYLYNCTDLDFAFRGQGYMSVPTRDVLISLHKIDGFRYDAQKHTITVGAGQHWTPVYEEVERHAPNYTGA
jgi:FAD/FMN-containing dehydrogenase